MGTTVSWWGDHPAGSDPRPDGARARLTLAGALTMAGALLFGGCIGAVGLPGEDPGGPGGNSTPSGVGGGVQPSGVGGWGVGGGGGAAPPPGVGGAAVTPFSGVGGLPAAACNTISPGRAPLRRLTTYEYNNTIRDLLNDTTINPGNSLPAQVDRDRKSTRLNS